MSSTSSTSSTTISSGVTTSGATFSALGIGSGIDLQSMISGLMTIEQQPQDALKTQLTQHNNLISAFQTLNTKFSTIRSAALNLNLGFLWKNTTASASDSSVTATTSGTATAGSLSFIVKNLASTQTSASFGTAASTSTVIGSGSLLIGQSNGIGLGNVTGNGLTTGSHTFTVTQASAGASFDGSPLSGSVAFAGTEQMTVKVDGADKTYTMAAGTYDQAGLAKMLNTVSGGDLSASVNNDGSLHVASAHEGSAATLEITGGDALNNLGLAVAGPQNGTDGIVEVDGVANTVSSIMPNNGNTVTLNSSAGTVDAKFEHGLRLGTTALKSISLGDGKLSSVVSAINGASAGVNASAVLVGQGQYKLQLQSTTTGSNGEIVTDLGAFASSLGTIRTVSAAQDATLQVGTGANAYTITSSSNTMSNVMPGLTLALNSADPAKTVTVNVTPDVSGLTDKVDTLVTSINDALTTINQNSKYDTSAKSAGIFLGNFTTENLQTGLYSAVAAVFPSSSLKTLSAVGITSNSDGTFAFDKTKFASAFKANPEAVASLFVDGGITGTPTGHPGLAEKLDTLTDRATNFVNGSIQTAIKGENTTITDLNTQITNWDDRLTKYKDQLIAQFSAMDTAVAGFKSTGTWLTSQITAMTKTTTA